MTTPQLVTPAALGRKQRLTEFRNYIEANRRTKTEKQIIAEYSINTGLSLDLVKSYMQLFYDAGYYVKPMHRFKYMILTAQEYEKAQAQFDRRIEQERIKRQKEDEALAYGID